MLSLLIGVLGVLVLLFQYGPQLLAALKALIDAIREKNAEQGKSAAADAFDLALKVVASLASRAGMNDEQKREQAWRDVRAGAVVLGITLSESDSRTLAELAYKRLKVAR